MSEPPCPRTLMEERGYRRRAHAWTVAASLLFVLGILLGRPPIAHACSCIEASQGELYREADYVVRATPLSTTPIDLPDFIEDWVSVRLEVTDAWKGPLTSGEMVVATGADSTVCGVQFSEHDDWIVYAHRVSRRPPLEETIVITSPCSGTRSYREERAADLDYWASVTDVLYFPLAAKLR